MLEFILFFCVLSPDQSVKCIAATAPSQEICEYHRDEMRALNPDAPMAIVCFPKEKIDEVD